MDSERLCQILKSKGFEYKQNSFPAYSSATNYCYSNYSNYSTDSYVSPTTSFTSCAGGCCGDSCARNCSSGFINGGSPMEQGGRW